MFDYTVTTKKSVDEAIHSLEEVLKEDQFGVLWNFDIRDTLGKKGFDYDKEFHVLEVCNPGAAKEVLTNNHMAGYFLPCKIVVYEHEGTTHIGMPKPKKLMELTGDHSLDEFAEDIENRLISAMDKAK
ncbi:DUF302 domain-containing protein [Virgibacillus xinjiangensis]|uniref:DUF302 domain-containing protein n=1 Tax=Virgibacillus xinjiangensis TaxID=393090 RepID=A0ABV7CT30_9BACI